MFSLRLLLRSSLCAAPLCSSRLSTLALPHTTRPQLSLALPSPLILPLPLSASSHSRSSNNDDDSPFSDGPGSGSRSHVGGGGQSMGDASGSGIGTDGGSASGFSSANFKPFGSIPSVTRALILPLHHPLLPGAHTVVQLANYSPTYIMALRKQMETHNNIIGVSCIIYQDEDAMDDLSHDITHVLEGRYVALEQAQVEQREKQKAIKRVRRVPVTPLQEMYSTGSLCEFTLEGTTLTLLAHRRIVLSPATDASEPPIYAQLENVMEPPSNEHAVANSLLDPTAITPDELRASMEEKALWKELNSTIHAYYKLDTSAMSRFRQLSADLVVTPDIYFPSRAADFSAYLAQFDHQQTQEILQTIDVKLRTKLCLKFWKQKTHQYHLQLMVLKTIREKMEAYHQRQLLKEQKKVIDEKLGNSRGNKEVLKAMFSDRLKGKHLSAPIRQAIESELGKLLTMEQDVHEYQTVRQYLDWLTTLPFGVTVPDHFDMKHAQEILDKDHFGMKDVKERILEFIATGSILNRVPPGKIICLVGPPGVGKTSIGRSISTALKRPFFKLSVGGLDDVSELKGHRRTYVGAQPGRLVQCLKTTGVENPVILIDEIDKLVKSFRGDPASALLEVLDPEQNFNFLDHYLDVPVDLSKALFVCTANTTDTIPTPLADRMDFIHISGYVLEEKLAIAQNFLEPSIRAKSGVSSEHVSISEDALISIIKHYSREAGVRKLKNLIESVYGKVALRLARADFIVNQQNADHIVNAETVDANNAVNASDVKVSESSESSSNAQVMTHDAVAPVTTDSTTVVDAPSTSTDDSIDDDSMFSTMPSFPPLVPSDLPITITPSNLSQYLGKPRYSSDLLYESPPVGVAIGLAYTPMGGVCLYIECTHADYDTMVKHDKIVVKDEQIATTKIGGRRVKGKKSKQAQRQEQKQQAPQQRGELFCTGQLGDVMKESSAIAYTVAKRQLSLLSQKLASVDGTFFSRNRIHLHFPMGGTPKDGPSAGITMVTALLSLSLNTPLPPSLSMTGELTLTGRVCAIGGVKDKLVAAKGANCSEIVLPAENKKDVLELPLFITKDVKIHYVENYEDVFNVAFPSIAQLIKQRDSNNDVISPSLPLSSPTSSPSPSLSASSSSPISSSSSRSHSLPAPLHIMEADAASTDADAAKIVKQTKNSKSNKRDSPLNDTVTSSSAALFY